jgi:hypothetical protein
VYFQLALSLPESLLAVFELNDVASHRSVAFSNELDSILEIRSDDLDSVLEIASDNLKVLSRPFSLLEDQLLHLVEADINIAKSAIDLRESSIDFIEASINLGESIMSRRVVLSTR